MLSYLNKFNQKFYNYNSKMQVEVPQILWHDKSGRIMSIDFYPNSDYLVTGSDYSEDDTGIRVFYNLAINLFCSFRFN